ncbi:MAG: plasmid pRiA4b ORF-3 family protein [Planctomycetaceae bacterium]|jgi:hypothetical protein|nr:plasmid pRiA4b ORF-3 family protein [Planctomycetaceae bacterium]
MQDETDKKTLGTLMKIFGGLVNRSALQPSKVKDSKPEDRRFLQLKVTLKGIEPPIWRTFVMLNTLTFLDLHMILQEIMGWEHCHPYEFTIGTGRNAQSLGGAPSYWGIDEGDQGKAVEFNLTFLKRKGMKFTYTYDFGDSWVHEIVVMDSDYNYSGEQPVWLLSGERNCPPEDCGGVYGYYDILEALKNPEEQNEILDWLGDYDPEYFSLDAHNTKLTRIFGNPVPKLRKKNTKKKKKKKK